mgnify:CR=1 FL=1
METVLVVFFKPSGKYYTEEQVPMPYRGEGEPVSYFKECLKNYLNGRLRDMVAVCIEPNHKFSYPIMVKVENL